MTNICNTCSVKFESDIDNDNCPACVAQREKNYISALSKAWAGVPIISLPVSLMSSRATSSILHLPTAFFHEECHPTWDSISGTFQGRLTPLLIGDAHLAAIFGKKGTGKSWMGWAAIHGFAQMNCTKRGRYVPPIWRFIDYRDLDALAQDANWGSHDDKEAARFKLRDLETADFVVIDEVGIMQTTGQNTGIITNLIRKRYETRKPTLLATTVSKEEFVNRLGEPTLDRASIVIEMPGDTRRRKLNLSGENTKET